MLVCWLVLLLYGNVGVADVDVVPQVTVYKLDASGRVVWHYPATVLERQNNCVRLEATFDRERVDIGPAVFHRGDRFVEYYYDDRWYNIFAVYEGEGAALKGWYCNVCRPAELGAEAIRCEDLALDVWVSPAGTPTIMDQDEFAALDLPERDRRHGRDALATLLCLAETGRLPR